MTVKLIPLGLWRCLLPRSLMVIIIMNDEHEDEELDILEPELYEEIAHSLPASVYYDETVGQPEILVTAAESDQDDLSEYLPGATKDEDDEIFNDDNGVSSIATEKLEHGLEFNETNLTSPQEEPVVTSPTGTLASSYSYFALSEPSTSGLTRSTVSGVARSKSDSGFSDTVPLAVSVKRRRSSVPEENPWKKYMSHAIKEEIRCKIQLKRINMGEEELKVEYERPETTISYDAVQRRHEVRERNKLYAKLSRQRAKVSRQQLVEENSSLLKEREELRHEIEKLKSRISVFDNSLREHESSCDVAEPDEASSQEDSDEEEGPSQVLVK